MEIKSERGRFRLLLAAPKSTYRVAVKNRKRPGLSRKALELIAGRFKVLSDPTRLRLLNALHDGELNVSQLVEAVGSQQANVSKHLSILADSMILGRRRAGSNVYYFIADDSILQICDLMCRKLQEEFDLRASELE